MKLAVELIFFTAQARFYQRPADGPLQDIHIHRLGQVILHPQAEGICRYLLRAVGGDQDGRDVVAILVQAAQQV